MIKDINKTKFLYPVEENGKVVGYRPVMLASLEKTAEFCIISFDKKLNLIVRDSVPPLSYSAAEKMLVLYE